MNFLVYSINYAPELTGIGKYNGEMCPWLADAGDTVHVVTAPPYYPEWKIHNGFNAYSFQSSKQHDVVVHRCPLYVPEKPTTIKRILHLSSFAASSAWRLFSLWKQKPDVVFVVEPTLFCVPAALLFCKLRGSKAVLHIQDYEVDAMLGLGMAGKSAGFIGRLAYGVESWLMKRFDKVSSISFSMLEKAKQKGVAAERLMFFPNWADTGFVTPEVDGSRIREAWGYKASDRIVLYAGNMGAKQGLELVIDAAQRFADQPDVKFVMVGSGAYVDTLKAIAAEKNLPNVDFKPLQAWEDVPAMLAMADVHLVVQKKGAADAVLPSKLTNILSAGGFAVVTAEPETELGRLATEYSGIYTCVEPENLDAFCTGLSVELERSNGTNMVARRYAEQNLDKNAILARFRQELLTLTGKY
ncbi:glycosyltransferase WbuB [Parathalassolituus penaei]|uniref:Glycosyltransferase WbuB n=1 Tax=Parathalassolituus penaei TaxID=2997323 RepID=A0A9X3EG48_9GAMM|nr:glycosyltransferase WbuB [Parathalassolituus penaei]MCY0966947.1 glycosyltransferase WbuB [Parathalassolituus penaei]